MNRPLPSSQALYSVPVHDLATAWRQHAMTHHGVDPCTELCAVPVLTIGHSIGWRPAFRLPATRTLVVIHTARPHASAGEARDCLVSLLTAMATEGSITLHGRAAA
ncbi:hypothetical protein [Halomonas rhizosphaerae]|uniref:Uncharacterized protein n=1 Tax=Halomonas rhizosphaerae TaxID=3043296 RepID=A0ABT6UXD5_9GAMM|nr:hypothetical protein [Halomonas rhizosphaerae]MDI5890639.1 hypothetical protein [Halomonas rhizosphaerae]